MFKYKQILILVTGSMLFLSGCSTAGLGRVQQTRGSYNTALNQSDNEQFLLNIARMRFDRSPFFVGVDSITAQTTLTYRSGIDDTKFGSQSAQGVSGAWWNLQPNIEFKQTPTVTYSPLQGTSYISGLLSPVNITQFNYLIQTNISIAIAFKLAVDNIGSLSNMADTWEHDGSDGPSSGSEFSDFVTYLDRERVIEGMYLFETSYKGSDALVIISKSNDVAAKISKMLHLDKTYNRIILSSSLAQKTAGNVVQFRTRSFFAILNFLSYSIDLSEQDIKKYGISDNVSDAQYKDLMQGLFKLKSSDSSPVNAYAKISYEGKWYYIDNGDVYSKATLMFLKLIYSLEAGEVSVNPFGSVAAP